MTDAGKLHVAGATAPDYMLRAMYAFDKSGRCGVPKIQRIILRMRGWHNYVFLDGH